jgi:hypothetical protein
MRGWWFLDKFNTLLYALCISALLFSIHNLRGAQNRPFCYALESISFRPLQKSKFAMATKRTIDEISSSTGPADVAPPTLKRATSDGDVAGADVSDMQRPKEAFVLAD